jgi:hypothetical protein
MQDINFKIFPTRFVRPDNQLNYLASYKTFKETWLDTFTEIFGEDYFYTSNDFSRQDYIQGLFIENQCVALDCIREINLKNPVDLDDSWLKPWKKEHIESMLGQGYERCLINSYFTVHKDFRKTIYNEKYNISYILGCLSVLHQLELGIPLMLGMMRNNRSMNTLGKSWGSSVVEQNVIHNTIPSDLVVFKSKEVYEASKNFPPIVFEIFKNRNTLVRKEEINEKVA